MNLDLLEVEPGVFSVLSNGVSYEVRVAGRRVWVSGREIAVSVEDARQWNPAKTGERGGGSESIAAPMPGKIVRLLVELGEQVAAGRGILVIEAMKMQNELKAGRSGTVTRVAVKQNDTVTAGTILVVIE